MDKEAKYVVIKGTAAFTISEHRKLGLDVEPDVVKLPEAADTKKLKKQYPHASIRQYEDSRLSSRYKSLVDRFTSNREAKKHPTK